MKINLNPDPFKQNTSKLKSGGTIIETLVALTLFATFLGGAGKLLISHRGLTDVTREHYTASNLAKNRIEEARKFGYAALDDFEESNTRIDSKGATLNSGQIAYYRRTTTIEEITENRLKEMVVTVEIKNRKTLIFASEEIVKSYIANPN